MLRQLKSDSDLDRGDAPALAVIRANAEQKALRKAVETQEELHRIRERICWTLSAYEVGEELTTKILEEKKSALVKEDAELQFFDDIATLTVILSDPIAKQKYQQKVTIFVVGYEDMCSQRSKLLIQLQQFFKENSASDDDFIMSTPEIDFDEVENNVREALDKAEKTTERLANISKDVLKVFEMVNPKDHKKGKRKLEKALFQSQQDVMHLTEKLVEVQSDFEETKTKLATLTQTVDLKEAELDRIKTEFNVNKGFEKECENYKKALQAKDEQLKTLKVQMEETEMTLSQAESKYDDYVEMCRNLRDENQYLRDETERKTNEQEERITQITKDLQNKYKAELKELKTMKDKELTQLKDAHEEELLRLKGKLSFQRRSITTSSTRDDSIPLESRDSATFSTTQSDDALQALSTWKSSAKTSRTIVEIRTSETSLEKTYSSDIISEEKISSMSELESGKMADTTDPATLKTAETMKTIERSCQTDDIENLDEMNELHKLKSKKDLLQIERDMVKTPTEELPQKLDEYKSKFSEVEQQLREEILQWKLRFNNKSLALDELSKNQEAQSKENQNLLEQLALAQNERMDAENEAERAILELEEMKAEKDSISDMTDMIEEKDNVISTESKTTVATEILDCLQTAHDNERNLLVSADMQCASTQVSRKPSARSSVNSDTLDIRGVSTQVSRKPSARSSPNSDTLDIRGVSTQVSRMPSARSSPNNDTLDIPCDSTQVSRMPSARSSRNNDTLDIPCGSAQVLSQPSAKSSANIDTTDEPEIVMLVQGLDVSDNKFDHEMDANKLTLPTRSNTSTASIGRVRSRLIRTAIKDHRVVEETVKTHEMISKFKVDIVIWLEQHGLGHKTELLNSIPDVPLDKGDEIDILKNMSSIRNTTNQVLDALWQITKDDYSWSHHKLVDGDEIPEEMDVGDNLGHHDSEVGAEMDIGYDDPYAELGAEKDIGYDDPCAELGAEKDIGYDDPSAEEGAEKDAQDGQRPSLESAEKISEIDGASTSVHQEPNLQDRSTQTIFVPRGAPTTPKGYTRLLHEYNNLNEEYKMLTQQLQDSVKSYQEQISQNATVMNEMQETINNLKTQLMEKIPGHGTSLQPVVSSMMFTRLDAERNVKTMKRAMLAKRLSPDSYDTVVREMSCYVSLPTRRLAELIKRYRHHCIMRDVEDNLKPEQMANGDVYELQEKMEHLQKARAVRWTEKMEEISKERNELGNRITSNLKEIEESTGIFLIKPVYSYMSRSSEGERTTHPVICKKRTPQTLKGARESSCVPGNPLGKMHIPTSTLIKRTWNMNESRVSENGLDYKHHNPVPRLLAMDINRFTLRKNLISNVIDIDSGHRGIRQYVAVERPIGTSNNHLNTDCVWKVPSPSRHELPIDNCPSNVIAHYPALPPINLQRSCIPSTNTSNQTSASSLSLASLEENIAAS